MSIQEALRRAREIAVMAAAFVPDDDERDPLQLLIDIAEAAAQLQDFDESGWHKDRLHAALQAFAEHMGKTR